MEGREAHYYLILSVVPLSRHIVKFEIFRSNDLEKNMYVFTDKTVVIAPQDAIIS